VSPVVTPTELMADEVGVEDLYVGMGPLDLAPQRQLVVRDASKMLLTIQVSKKLLIAEEEKQVA
jgi:hypothetical protein